MWDVLLHGSLSAVEGFVLSASRGGSVGDVSFLRSRNSEEVVISHRPFLVLHEQITIQTLR